MNIPLALDVGQIGLIVVLTVIGISVLGGLIRIVDQYERAIVFRLGKINGGAREPGMIVKLPLIDRVVKVSMQTVTRPIQSQGIITKDNVTVDISAVAYYRIINPIASVVEIEDVEAAMDQLSQTTMRAVIGKHTLDESLSETDAINASLRELLDRHTETWGVEVITVELRDIQLPESMQRAMAKEAEAEREKRAKIIAAEGEALAAGQLAEASDVMMKHPLALQLRNLQTLTEIAVENNSTVVFPAPLMSTVQEIGNFLRSETDSRSAPTSS